MTLKLEQEFNLLNEQCVNLNRFYVINIQDPIVFFFIKENYFDALSPNK